MCCDACVGTCPINCMFLYETRIEDRCIKGVFCGRDCSVGAITLKKE